MSLAIHGFLSPGLAIGGFVGQDSPADVGASLVLSGFLSQGLPLGGFIVETSPQHGGPMIAMGGFLSHSLVIGGFVTSSDDTPVAGPPLTIGGFLSTSLAIGGFLGTAIASPIEIGGGGSLAIPMGSGNGITAVVSVMVTSLAPAFSRSTLDIPLNGDLTIPIPLPGASLTASLGPSPVAGDRWRVTSVAHPSIDLGSILAALDQSNDAVLQLFGPQPTGNYLEWKRMWQADLPLPYRLGAVLMAYAARVEELRVHEG